LQPASAVGWSKHTLTRVVAATPAASQGVVAVSQGAAPVAALSDAAVVAL
jgi:hypothetical protein